MFYILGCVEMMSDNYLIVFENVSKAPFEWDQCYRGSWGKEISTVLHCNILVVPDGILTIGT